MMDKNIYRCEICGKEYSISNKLSRHISKEHNISKKEYYDTYLKKEGEGICPVCGKPTYFLNIISGYRSHCSTSCSSSDPGVQEKLKISSLKIYGVENPRFADEVKNKISLSLNSRTEEEKAKSEEKKKETCLKRYEVEYVLQVEEFREKGKITLLEEYGVENAAQSSIIQDRIKATKLDRYDNENYNNPEKISQTLLNRTDEEKAESLAKTRHTKLKRYDDANYNNIEQVKLTNLSRYGVTCTLRSEQSIEKSKATLLKYYNVEHPSQSDEIKAKIKQTRKLNELQYQENNDCTNVCSLIKKYGQGWYKNNLVEMTPHGSGNYVSNEDLEKIEEWAQTCRRQSSMFEISVKEYLQTIYKGDIIKSRKIIAPYEIDLFIPEFNIGIECNGTYWHSMLCNDDKKYHLMKSRLAEEKGIRLIHIYEFEWLDEDMNAKIKQMLKIALGKVDTRIYARDCKVKQISNKEAKVLNEEVHLQSHRNAQVTYGLYYRDQLVQIMSFSKTRYNKNIKNDNEWEIIRGCPGSNNIVIGGVSKLFKHFIRDYDPVKIFSYCDFNKFDGTSYEKLGMKFIGYTGPNKWYWLDNYKVVPRNPNKYSFYKEHTLSIIWGSGSKKYEWIKEEVI